MENGAIMSCSPSIGTDTPRSWPIRSLQGPGTKTWWETEAQRSAVSEVTEPGRRLPACHHSTRLLSLQSPLVTQHGLNTFLVEKSLPVTSPAATFLLAASLYQ